MKKQFEKSDLETGMRAICDDGSTFVVVAVDCETENKSLATILAGSIFRDILLFNGAGIVSGTNYDENLRHLVANNRDIVRVYNPPSKPDVLLNPSVKGDLIWQREEKATS